VITDVDQSDSAQNKTVSFVMPILLVIQWK